MIAASIPYEGDGKSPAMEYAEAITLEPKEEKPTSLVDKLEIGGAERLMSFMSQTK